MFIVDHCDWNRLKEAASECDEKTVAELKALIDKGELTIQEVDHIAELLPETAPFYKFGDALRLKPRVLKVTEPTPEYRERIERLRREQESREYNQMISSVDSAQNYGRTNLMSDFSKDMKEANRQALAVFNTLITVGGAFVFGFYGITFAYPSLRLDVGTRVIIGMILATVVFFADLYFIAKSMDPPKPQPNATFKLDTKRIGEQFISKEKPEEEKTEKEDEAPETPKRSPSPRSRIPTTKSPKARRRVRKID